MKQTITKNDKNLKILNKLINNGFYKGYVKPEKFELLRNHFPNGYTLIGILKHDGKYEVSFDFKFPMNILAKFLLLFGILTSIIFIINGNWIMPIAFLVMGLFMLTIFKRKKRKEMNLFTSKFLDFDKMEYD